MYIKDEVLSILQTQPNGNIEQYNFQRKYPELYQEIQSLYFPENFKWTQKLFHFFHDDFELNLGHCPICGKRCKFQKFNLGYSKHCSYKCAQLNKETQNKIKNTNLKRHGKEYYTQTDEYRERFIQTCQENWDVNHPSKSLEIQNKKKETCQKHFGVDYSFQSEIVKEKSKQTCQEKYNKDYYTQTDEYKERYKNSCQENWGVNSYMETSEFRQKSIDTCQKKWGVNYFSQTDEWYEKTKQISQEKWNVDNYSQTEEYNERIKNTNRERYGVDYYTQTEECKQKSKNTCQEKWGVDNYAQTNEHAKYHRKRVKYDNQTFDSSWEIKVYKFCKEHNIPCEYQPNISIEYMFQGTKHYYHPDFLINGQLYEVKGDQFFDGDKMINPYDKENDLFEAKHQCMINNGVIILRGEHIKTLDKVFLS